MDVTESSQLEGLCPPIFAAAALSRWRGFASLNSSLPPIPSVHGELSSCHSDQTKHASRPSGLTPQDRGRDQRGQHELDFRDDAEGGLDSGFPGELTDQEVKSPVRRRASDLTTNA
jgi:hypothetical protein